MEHARMRQNGPAGPWLAPAAAGPVRARLTIPGSKSMTNRALVLAALADGPGTIRRPLHARDTLLMRQALTALGATISDHVHYASDVPGQEPVGQRGVPRGSAPQASGQGPSDGVTGAFGPAGGSGGSSPRTSTVSWHVVPGQPAADTSVDVGNAGTVMRFAPPVAALSPVSVRFHGDPRAAQRPVGPVLAALRELGAVIDDDERGAFPFTVRGTGSLTGGAVMLDASASSQFVS